MAGFNPPDSGPDRLSLVWAVRNGAKHRAERRYLDFEVNGRPLSALIPVGDSIGVLGWQSREYERRHARQLLLREPAPFADGLVPIYICAECADLGCGAVTVRITLRDDCVVWSDLGWGDLSATARFDDPAIRDLWFDRQEYVTVIGGYSS